MSKINSEKLNGNIKLLSIPSEQFKTSLINVYIKRPLVESEVTMNSLIPSVLKLGSQKLQTQKEISKELQGLYGSAFGVGVGKIGEKQILNFKLSVTDDSFLSESVLDRALEVMLDIILNPLVESEGFKEEYLKIEKEVLQNAILAKKNHKPSYAMERCIEEMCQDEAYGISEDGKLEDIDKITSKELYEHYKNIILESEIDVAITGKADLPKIKSILEKRFEFRTNEIQLLQREEFIKNVDNSKYIEEKMDVSQGKIVMGYRTNVDVRSEEYVALFLYSIILGGGPNSKLFVNVREKHSLCYSINSFLEKIKGIMFVTAGIDPINYHKSLELINKQMDEMAEGNITENELLFAKKFIVNNLQALKDSIWSIADYYYNLDIQGRNESVEEFLEKINQIQVEDIKNVSKKIQLDTIYFLTNNEEAN